jgi:uncharacterized protein YkwD
VASFALPPSRRAVVESTDVGRAEPIARGLRFEPLPEAPGAAVVEWPSNAQPAGPSATIGSADASPPAEAPTEPPVLVVVAPPVPVAPAPDPVVAPVPRAVVAPPAPPVTTTGTAAVEARTLVLMNASRAQGGLVALRLDAAVSSVARTHSAAEARARDLWHDGSDGTARARDGGACGSGWYGENTGRIWNGNAEALNAEFMAEPWAPINHRTNIMDPNFRRVGIGAVQGPDAIYATIVFCR